MKKAILVMMVIMTLLLGAVLYVLVEPHFEPEQTLAEKQAERDARMLKKLLE